MINRTQTFSKDYEIHLLEEIKTYAAVIYKKDNVLFELFSLLFQLYEVVETDLIFEELKALFSEHFRNLRSIDQSLFLTQLINYAIRKTNIGEAKFSKEALDLYKIGLEADLVLRDGNIDEAVYGNIVTLDCHAKEFEWVDEFLNQYKVNLKKEIREDAFTLNKGIWFFHQKQFENARNQYLNYSFSSKFQPKVRSNLILTIFEQFLLDESQYDLLNAQLNAFEKYLQRNNTIADYRKEAHLNLISILKKLTSGIFEKKDLKKLKQSIKNQFLNKKKHCW